MKLASCTALTPTVLRWLLDVRRFVHARIYFCHAVRCVLTLLPNNENPGNIVVRRLGYELNGPGFKSRQGTGAHSTSYSLVITVIYGGKAAGT